MAQNGTNIIDLTVHERAIRDARKAFCDMLSERVLLALLNSGSVGAIKGDDDAQAVVVRAWDIAERQYDEMIRRRAQKDAPVSLAERMVLEGLQARA